MFTQLAMPIKRNHRVDEASDGAELEKRATVLKELSAALSQAAELLEETAPVSNALTHKIEAGIDFYQEVTRFEIALIRCALRQTDGNQKEAARLLAINSTTLNAMIKRHGINITSISNKTQNQGI
jgi:transcriptional regulator with GAF, ATPase, and Fis domain